MLEEIRLYIENSNLSVEEIEKLLEIYAQKHQISLDMLRREFIYKRFDMKKVEMLAKKLNDEKILKIMNDISKYSEADEKFRGWVLPDGQMISYFYDESSAPKIVQDHGQLFRIFLSGLEVYDTNLYKKIKEELKQYSHNNFDANEPYESFAVERLGWLQVGIFGKKWIICRGEKFQDKYLHEFINKKNFHMICHNKGSVLNLSVYPNFKHIFMIGLKRRYKPSIKDALDEINRVSALKR